MFDNLKDIHKTFYDYIVNLQAYDTQYLGAGNWLMGQIRPTKLFDYILDGGIDLDGITDN